MKENFWNEIDLKKFSMPFALDPAIKLAPIEKIRIDGKELTPVGKISISNITNIDNNIADIISNATKKQFYDDEILDFLLEDLVKAKAKETEKELQKLIKKDKRAKINDFIASIKNVYFNEPYTIVIWKDGSKTVVKCQEDDTYDKEKGLAMCIIKKQIGGNLNDFNTIFKKLIYEKED